VGLLDKAKAAAEQAAAKAKDTASDLQTKRELGQAYDDLGQKAYELAEAGELVSTPLEPLVARIRELKTQLEETPEPVGATAESSE
jgi:hypothetical protein